MDKVQGKEKPDYGQTDVPADDFAKAPADPSDRGTFRFIDADGRPTNDEFEEFHDPDTGQPMRRKNRLADPKPGAHGVIAHDPYARIDRAGHPNMDAKNREVRNDAPGQGGEDPGRVFDAAGANNSVGYLHHSLPDSARATGFDRLAAPKAVPVVPLDSPGTTGALLARSFEKTVPTDPVAPTASAPIPEPGPVVSDPAPAPPPAPGEPAADQNPPTPPGDGSSSPGPSSVADSPEPIKGS